MGVETRVSDGASCEALDVDEVLSRCPEAVDGIELGGGMVRGASGFSRCTVREEGLEPVSMRVL